MAGPNPAMLQASGGAAPPPPMLLPPQHFFSQPPPALPVNTIHQMQQQLSQSRPSHFVSVVNMDAHTFLLAMLTLSLCTLLPVDVESLSLSADSLALPLLSSVSVYLSVSPPPHTKTSPFYFYFSSGASITLSLLFFFFISNFCLLTICCVTFHYILSNVLKGVNIIIIITTENLSLIWATSFL